MDHQNDRDELSAAWRALSRVDASKEGWLSIPLRFCQSGRLRAGRHFPGNLEALLVGFSGIAAPAPKSLPQGREFDVCTLDLPVNLFWIWIALRRRSDANLDLFTTMAEDLSLAVVNAPTQTEVALFNACLYRIRAWQDFMDRGPLRLLSAEAELGLFGELTVLGVLMTAGLDAEQAVEDWVGSEDELQDFRLGHGALEVKTSSATAGFPARIISLEQLDDSERSPLVLAAIRLKVEESGMSLPNLVTGIQGLLAEYPRALNSFESKLIWAGYLHGSTESYQRQFKAVQTRFFLVEGNFPRLTRSSVPNQVTHANYIVDLDRVSGRLINSATEVLRELGAI